MAPLLKACGEAEHYCGEDVVEQSGSCYGSQEADWGWGQAGEGDGNKINPSKAYPQELISSH